LDLNKHLKHYYWYFLIGTAYSSVYAQEYSHPIVTHLIEANDSPTGVVFELIERR
jgi:hypothetical protein